MLHKAITALLFIVEGLEIDEQRITDNLDMLEGMLFSEALMFHLGKKVGKQTAPTTSSATPSWARPNPASRSRKLLLAGRNHRGQHHRGGAGFHHGLLQTHRAVRAPGATCGRNSPKRSARQTLDFLNC